MPSSLEPRTFSDKEELLLVWLVTPDNERGALTKTALAQTIGISRDTLYAWINDPRIMAEARRRVASELHAATPQVLQVIKQKALAGEHKFVTLFLSLVGEASIVAGANAREVIHTMSVEEAERIIARVIAPNSEEQAQPNQSMTHNNTTTHTTTHT